MPVFASDIDVVSSFLFLVVNNTMGFISRIAYTFRDSYTRMGWDKIFTFY